MEALERPVRHLLLPPLGGESLKHGGRQGGDDLGFRGHTSRRGKLYL